MTVTNAQLTLLAAVVAAAASLVSVVIAARSASRTELRRWRRQDEREMIARILTQLHVVRGLWNIIGPNADAERAGELDPFVEREVRNARIEVGKAEKAFRLAVAEVELVAGSKVVECAKAFDMRFEGLQHLLRPAGGAEQRTDYYWQHDAGLEQLRTELVDAVRKELQIDRAPKFRRSLRTLRESGRRAIGSVRYRLTARLRQRRQK
ncbi:hypothetical protein ACXIZN_31360 [Amycolatopsis sp. TRM77291]